MERVRNTHIGTHKDAKRDKHTRTRTHTHTHTHIYIYIPTHNHTHIHTYTNTHIYTYAHIHTHTHKQTYIHTHIHTHTHTHPHKHTHTHRHILCTVIIKGWFKVTFTNKGEGEPDLEALEFWNTIVELVKKSGMEKYHQPLTLRCQL